MASDSVAGQLAAVVDALATLDVGALDADEFDNDTLARLVRAQEVAAAKLEAASVAITKVWDERRLWKSDGARTGSAWLAGNTTLDPTTARRRVRQGDQLAELPATRTAFEAGRLSADQVARLTKLEADDSTRDAFRADEAGLVDAIAGRPALDTTRIIGSWKHRQAGDAAQRDANKQRRKRRVAMWEDDRTGMGHIHIELHPEAYAEARNCVQRLVDDDWTRSHRRGPNGQTAPADTRTFDQRRADAFVSMIERAAATIGHEGDYTAPGVLINVNVAYETLLERAPGAATETTSGVLLTGEAARRLACHAGISRHITKGGSVLLDKGRTVRTVTGPQRSAVLARDGGCTHPACDAPPQWCQVHHTDPFHDGKGTGRTDIDDLTSACGHHHHLVHEDGWTVEGFQPDVHHQIWISPTGDRYPARHRGKPFDPPDPPPSNQSSPEHQRAMPTNTGTGAIHPDPGHRQLALTT